jgi:hypothetical protein
MIEIPIIRDAFDIYSRHYSSLGDYSATTIIDSPRRVALFKRYGEAVDYTPESQAASLVGTAVHDKMEELLKMANVKHPSYIVEGAVAHPVTIFYDEGQSESRLLGGKFDVLADKKHLIDIKTCKTWKLIFDPDKIEWTKQLNIYAWLLRNRGIEVETLTVVAFYLDWIESHTIGNRQYPEEPIIEYEIGLWSAQDQEDFVRQRMKAHIDAEEVEDNDLPQCTMAETWEREPEFAIFKKAEAKRATKVCKNTDLHGTIEVAQSIKGINKESYIEVRYQTRKRCEKFCAINEYCNQYDTYVKSGGLTKRNEKFYLGGVL